MTNFTMPRANSIIGNTSRSMGLKLLLIGGLAMIMALPSLFVTWLVADRTERAAVVAREVGRLVGGRQTFLGPTLCVPYTIPPTAPGEAASYGTYIVSPAQASATVQTSTVERRRSLFKVPVFRAALQLDAAFDLANVPAAAPAGSILDWKRAQIKIGVSDARGALANATLAIGGRTVTMIPAGTPLDLTVDEGNDRNAKLVYFAADAGDFARPDARFEVRSALRFSGAQRIAVLAYGRDTRLTAAGDWPSPGFDGAFLPVRHTVTDHGFTAEWSVPFIARGVAAEAINGSISGIRATALGISFVEVADPYQSVNRALKYVLLFLGLVFICYFMFEVTTGKRVHPAQYILVGVAQIIFYLLLLALAERIGFDSGFLMAGAATVALLSTNAAWIFESRMQGFRALACFSLLYALIYMMLRLEDNALLAGAVTSFVAVAAAMYFTRKIDWYGSLPGESPGVPPSPGAGPASE